MDFSILLDDLPVPKDDGACDHLLGMKIPHVLLPSVNGSVVDICQCDANFLILYFFPMMADPLRKKLPLGWDEIPGARGCTPQNIAIRESYVDMMKYGACPVGVSTQPVDDLSRIAEFRKLTQAILSDNDLKLQKKLHLPTFQLEGKNMYKRLTLIIENSEIIKIFYPIQSPDLHAFEILKWLEKNV